MKDLIFATNNKHKIAELKKCLPNVNLLSLSDLNISVSIAEDGDSFLANSLIKCKTIFEATHTPVIADDSGLSVDQLNGQPGIYSARYGKPEFNDIDRYNYLLSQMDFSKPTDASFICTLSLYITNGRIYTVQEEIRGRIVNAPKGENGFGYDPIFFVEQFGKTFAELSDEQKNSISHRGKASRIMAAIIEQVL